MVDRSEACMRRRKTSRSSRAWNTHFI